MGKFQSRDTADNQLQNEYAEKIECRHIQICRYFGEEINASDPAIKKAYCGTMCDVRSHEDSS